MTKNSTLPSQIIENSATVQLYRASLSTMWAVNNFDRLEDFFNTAGQLGYASIELNHQVTPEMLQGIDLRRYRFSSVHEPCPTPVSTDELKTRDWMISSLDKEKRAHGVDGIKRSIDLAHQLGVPVVMHGGQVSTPQTLERKLRALYNGGLKGTPAYEALQSQMVDERQRVIQPHLEAVKKSVAELLDYAAPLGVRIGLENRYHWTDIPTQDEMAELLTLGNPQQLGFWFDIGHATALDRLGFYSLEGWLSRFSTRLVGCHLHDVIGLEDHQSPGMGDVDFEWVGRYLPENLVRTLELHPRMTAQQVQDGIRFLAQKGIVASR